MNEWTQVHILTKEKWMNMNDFECVDLKEGRPSWRDD
jgi:hypothetical protein